MLVFGIFLS